MITPPSPRTTTRTQLLHRESRALADFLGKMLPEDGRAELQPGLSIFRASRPTAIAHTFSMSCFCVIAQGAKEVRLGSDRLLYDPDHYLIGTIGLPTQSRIVRASPDEPYLSLRLTLDAAQVSSTMAASGFVAPKREVGVKAMAVSPLGSDLLDASMRLLKLAQGSDDYRVLGPLAIQEIIYRLLLGNQGHRLTQLATGEGRDHRVAKAIRRLRESFSQPFRVAELAGEVGMSVSSFHAHFKAVTAMSPLQFLKRLRLQEARRLMLSEALNAAQAGFHVGYEDASHFNREYKHYFGVSPIRDVRSLQPTGTAARVL